MPLLGAIRPLSQCMSYKSSSITPRNQLARSPLPVSTSQLCSRRANLQVLCAKKKSQRKAKPQKPKQRVQKEFSGDGNRSSRSSSRSSSRGMFGGMQQDPLGMMVNHVMQQMTDERIPPFHKEFEQELRKPDPRLFTSREEAAILSRAEEAYSSARLQAMNKAAIFLDNPRIALDPSLLLMRFGAKLHDPAAMEWLVTAPMNSVMLNDKPLKYDSGNVQLQSFSNVPAEAVHMLPGSTHVAVGFVDLGGLAAAVSRWEVDQHGQLAAFPFEFNDSRPGWKDMQHELQQEQQDQQVQLHLIGAEEQQGAVLQGGVDPELAGVLESSGLVNAHALQMLQRVHRLNCNTRHQQPSRAWSSSSSSSQDPVRCSDGSSSLGSSIEPVASSGALGMLSIAAGGAAAGGGEGPLLWVGYDASPYAVAKAAVLAEMMKQGADGKAVLQVWYSSCWSTTTKEAFSTALTAVLDCNSSSTGHRSTNPTGISRTSSVISRFTKPVLRLLQHWQQRGDVSLSESRKGWLQLIKNAHAKIGGFKKHCDRLGLTKYLFTGELLGGDVGSTVMFALPPGSGEMACDENFLQAISFPTIMRERLAADKTRTAAGVGDFVDAGVRVVLRRIKRLTDLVQAGRVKVQLNHARVLPDSEAVMSAIHQLQPDSMSWSNVPDYMGAQSFHQLAQRCSAAATVHFMHSMNWIRDVKGACHLDMLMARQAAAEAGCEDVVDEVNEGLQDMLEVGELAIMATYNQFGADDLLLVPPVDNARNVLDFLLQRGCYKVWLDAYLECAEQLAAEALAAAASNEPNPWQYRTAGSSRAGDVEMQQPAFQSCLLGKPSYGPFQRASSTVSFAFVQYGCFQR